MGVDAFVVGYEAGRASMQPPSEAAAEDDPSLDRVELVPITPGQPVEMEPTTASPAPGPTFDMGRAYGAIAAVDLSPCKASGLATGYGHAVVVFAPDGSATGVSFELPPSSSPGARECVVAAFREMRIPAFTGDQVVKVRRAFYVS